MNPTYLKIGKVKPEDTKGRYRLDEEGWS